MLYKYIYILGEISSLYTILQITQIVIVVLGGLILFREKITINKIIGVISSIFAIIFLLKK